MRGGRWDRSPLRQSSDRTSIYDKYLNEKYSATLEKHWNQFSAEASGSWRSSKLPSRSGKNKPLPHSPPLSTMGNKIRPSVSITNATLFDCHKLCLHARTCIAYVWHTGMRYILHLSLHLLTGTLRTCSQLYATGTHASNAVLCLHNAYR